MAVDVPPIPNQNESVPVPKPAELQNSPGTEKAPEPHTEKRSRRFLPRTGSLSFFKIDRYLKLTVSIILRTSIVVGVVFIAIYLYRELNDRSYHIQEFEVPEDLVAMGYNGKVMAYRLQYEVDYIVDFASLTWSPKEIEEYNQSADKAPIQAEVAGLGFSPETIIRYVKQVLGISYRSISGVVVHYDNRLILDLRISGEEKDRSAVFSDNGALDETIQNSLSDALNKLVKKAARRIVGLNNPLLLGIFYDGNWSNPSFPHGDSVAIPMFQKAIRTKPAQAADAYAWWANSIFKRTRDTIQAISKLKRALKLDPNNAPAYRVLGAIKFRNGDFAGGEELTLKSLELDPTSALTWNALGLQYRGKNGEKDIEAEKCFREASTRQPANIYIGELCQVLLLEQKYDEAVILTEKPFYNNFEINDIVILEGTRDTTSAIKLFNEKKKEDSKDLSNSLNNFAFLLEFRKAGQKEAFHYTRMAIKADSTNALPYTTLAELYGLKSDESNFYLNLEKALKLGFDVNRLDDNDEPYKSFAQQSRYKELKIRYGSKK